MGCDIHTYYEIKVSGRWTHYNWRPQDSMGGTDYEKLFDHPLYIPRCYDLFSILANVRNGRGFAGVETGIPVVPICEPKGLPEDVSNYIKKESDDWGIDGHSHSWHTLETLLNYDWDQVFKKCGWVNWEQYQIFLKKGKPENYSGMIVEPNIKHVLNEDMINDSNYYTKIYWNEKYSERLDFFIKILKKLKELGEVRIVFFFDN